MDGGKVVATVNGYTHDDLAQLFSHFERVLREGTPLVDALRLMFQLLVLRPDRVDLPDSVLGLLYQRLLSKSQRMLVQDCMLLCHVMKESGHGTLPIYFSQNLGGRIFYFESRVPFVLPIINSLMTSDSLRANLTDAVGWCDHTNSQPIVRSSALPFVSIAAMTYPHLLDRNAHIKPVEESLRRWLTVSPSSRPTDTTQSSSLFRKRTPTATVTELDGGPAQGFLSVLNHSIDYNEDTMYNAHALSMLHAWVASLYTERTTVSPTVVPPLAAEFHAPFAQHKMDGDMVDTVVRVLERVLSQAEHDVRGGSGPGSAQGRTADFVESVVLEALRLCDLLCLVEAEAVHRIYANVRKLYTRTKDRYNGAVLIGFLKFFLAHSEKVGSDAEGVLTDYFVDHLTSHYRNPLTAFETLNFCIENREALFAVTSALSDFVPAIFRPVVWFPRSCTREFAELLPALLSPTSFLTVIHCILDLPLMAAACERSEVHAAATTAPSSHAYGDPNDAEFAQLFRHLLRHEASGVGDGGVPEHGKEDEEADAATAGTDTGGTGGGTGAGGTGGSESGDVATATATVEEEGAGITPTSPASPWDDKGMMNMAHRFAQSTTITPRIRAAAKLVPGFLELALDVLLADADQSTLLWLVPVLCKRVAQLHLLGREASTVRTILVHGVVAVCSRHARSLTPLHGVLVHVLRSSGQHIQSEELIVQLCWLVGEYCGHIDDKEKLETYVEALELLVYDRIADRRRHSEHPDAPTAATTTSSIMSGASATPGGSGFMASGGGAGGGGGGGAGGGGAGGAHAFVSGPSGAFGTDEDADEDDGYTRQMCVVITALTKIASHHHDLVPRVMLDLSKVVRHRRLLHRSVIVRANECVRLLKYPSIAAAVFSRPTASLHHNTFTHVDENSSLPFVLQPRSDWVPGADRLHPFALGDE